METVVARAAFWEGRRVFITGHTGFKGGWLALWLNRLGATVTGYALRPPTTPSFFELAGVGRGIDSVIADIRDASAVEAALRHAQPEIVFHLAAQPLVRRSYADPVETYSVNVVGTANLLDAVRRTPSVRAVVNVTSDKCYENKEWVWGYREGDRLGGHDPYSNSKACAELVAQAFRDSFFAVEGRVALASARAGNVIGGGDWAEDRLVPDFVRAILAGRPVQIRRPQAIRPWQHVLDPLGGYLLLGQQLLSDGARWAGGWNFGPRDSDAKTVEWIVERVVKLWGGSAAWERDPGEHPHEARFLKLDISKARQELGWQPTWTIDDALAETVAWYRVFADKRDLRAVSLAQIEEFERRSMELGKTS